MQNRNEDAPVTWALLTLFHTHYLFIGVSVLVNCTPSAGLSGPLGVRTKYLIYRTVWRCTWQRL